VSAADAFVAVVGRFALFDIIASGGMATVHYGRMIGEMGFSRVVAVKRMHQYCASNPEFSSMFLDEARIAWRIRHPNVVPIVEVVSTGEELLLVMEYVHGETLGRLQKLMLDTRSRASIPLAAAIVVGLLEGLHAAHEARGEDGEPLQIVHRDVSPQNVMIGTDGAVRVLDFGVAKATGRIQTTSEGQLKGKIAYMALEQLSGLEVDRRADVYAAGVVLWELLAGRRLFEASSQVALLHVVANSPIRPPSTYNAAVNQGLDAVVMRALSRDPQARFATAREMAAALEQETQVATPRALAQWLESLTAESLRQRAAQVAAIEALDIRALLQSLNLVALPAGGMPPPGAAGGLTPISNVTGPHVVRPGLLLSPLTDPSAALSSPGAPLPQAAARRSLYVIAIAIGVVLAAALVAILIFVLPSGGAPAAVQSGSAPPATPVPDAAPAEAAAQTAEAPSVSTAPSASAAPSAPRPRKLNPIRPPQGYDPYGHQ
jgi:serine/threonine-protein kinase